MIFSKHLIQPVLLLPSVSPSDIKNLSENKSQQQTQARLTSQVWSQQVKMIFICQDMQVKVHSLVETQNQICEESGNKMTSFL